MILIPLPFLLTFAACFLIWQQRAAPLSGRPNPYLIGFLAILALHTALVGLRFGYGLSQVLTLQPFTAALIPVLGYLAFAPPARDGQALWHLWVLVAVAVAITLGTGWIDLMLAAIGTAYAAALIAIGIRGEDALPWVALGRLAPTRRALWAVVALLALTALTDAAIVLDFRLTAGSNLMLIATGATVLVLLAMVALWVKWRAAPVAKAEPTAPLRDVEDVFDRVAAYLAAPDVVADPDLNLNRIARRLTLPARDVSRAINQRTGQNLSQYVNSLRIDLACQLLRDTDASVTEIQFRAGFNTKSNFNREFGRVTGKSPSAYRKDAA